MLRNFNAKCRFSDGGWTDNKYEIFQKVLITVNYKSIMKFVFKLNKSKIALGNFCLKDQKVTKK